MSEPDITRDQTAVRNPEVAYDVTDLSARAVIAFLIFLAIGGIFIGASLWGVYKSIVAPSFISAPGAPATVTGRQALEAMGGDPALRFPPPRLQPDPVADLDKFRVREEEILNSYGWVDQANGKVHIPIEQAIGLIAAAGLPVRPNPVSPSGNQLTAGPAAAGGVDLKAGEGKLPAMQQ